MGAAESGGEAAQLSHFALSPSVSPLVRVHVCVHVGVAVTDLYVPPFRANPTRNMGVAYATLPSEEELQALLAQGGSTMGNRTVRFTDPAERPVGNGVGNGTLPPRGSPRGMRQGDANGEAYGMCWRWVARESLVLMCGCLVLVQARGGHGEMAPARRARRGKIGCTWATCRLR